MNITTLWKRAQKKNIRYIVMRHNQPIFDVKPIKQGGSFDDLAIEIAQARAQVARGEFYTTEEILQSLNEK